MKGETFVRRCNEALDEAGIKWHVLAWTPPVRDKWIRYQIATLDQVEHEPGGGVYTGSKAQVTTWLQAMDIWLY